MRHLFSACGAVVFAVTLILSHSIWKCEAEICSIFFLSYFSPALNTQYKACLKHPEPVFGYISWRFCYEVAQATARDGLGTMDSSYLSGNRIISHGKMPFFQFRGFSFWWDATAGSIIRGKKNNATNERTPDEGSPETISQFQSVCTALAATVGTGNIAGVATALTAGGPGALFWMWVSAFIGMITAYGETCLGIRFRLREPDGRFLCGPFLYMEHGLNVPFMAVLYSILCIMCALGMGSMVQANSAVTALSFTFNLPLWLPAVCFTLLTGAVIRGGIQSIGRTAERLRPGSRCDLCPLFPHRDPFLSSCPSRRIKGYFRLCFSYTGCRRRSRSFLISRSVRYGIARGVFSNEAGLGTLAVLHGPAEHTTPEKQGMWAMFEVFFDTVVLCTLTALVILCTSQGDIETFSLTGAALAAACFSARSGIVGKWFISVSMVVFAFATIMAGLSGQAGCGYFIGRWRFGEMRSICLRPRYIRFCLLRLYF